MNLELACFISPHGYGHATRTIALLQAIQKQIPGLTAHLFTVAPSNLFENSNLSLILHPVVTDVGLIQSDAFTTDQTKTIAELSDLLPFRQSRIDQCVNLCRSCRMILCDISCLGIAVGRAAGIPSVLIENFTWDWIYEHLDPPENDMRRFAEIFTSYYQQANYRIQTDPLCNPLASDLRCGPMARMPIFSRDEIREQIDSGGRKIVLITMGGIPLDLPFIEQLHRFDKYLFIIAGQSVQRTISPNVRLLSSDTSLHHPDLINGSDLVICKSGYSTIAECLQTKTPICCVSRNNFAESAVLDRYVSDTMNGTILYQDRFFSGSWLDSLPGLMKEKRESSPVNGADQAASFILSLM